MESPERWKMLVTQGLTLVGLLAKSQKASNWSEKQADSKSRYNARARGNAKIKQELNVSVKFRKIDRLTRVDQRGESYKPSTENDK